MTVDPVRAAALSMGLDAALGWPTAWGAPDIGRQLYIHGAPRWGSPQALAAQASGLDDRACGRVVACGTLTAWVELKGDRPVVRGGVTPIRGRCALPALRQRWPRGVRALVVLEDVHPVDPVPAAGGSTPWVVDPALLETLEGSAGATNALFIAPDPDPDDVLPPVRRAAVAMGRVGPYPPHRVRVLRRLGEGDGTHAIVEVIDGPSAGRTYRAPFTAHAALAAAARHTPHVRDVIARRQRGR